MAVDSGRRMKCLLVALAVAVVAAEAVVGVVPPSSRQGSKRFYNPPPNQDHANYLAQMKQIVQLLKDRPDLAAQYNYAEQRNDLDGSDVYVPFNCPPLDPSSTPPITAHTVRPGDIKVIGALGDSITAGNGVRARAPIEVSMMNRGESWSIGGERDLENRVLTIPNILRNYNPDIIGASDCRRRVATEESGLNVAVPGDTNRGMADQANELMLLMLENPAIDYYNDWKLVTIFIGGNDLCQFCNFPGYFTADAYYQGIQDALDLFKNHLPRAIVNLQPMFDVSIVKDMNFVNTTDPNLCPFLHAIMCPCNRDELLDAQQQLQKDYFKKMVLLTDGRYDDRSDFTVVLQPHMRDMVPWKNPDGTFDMSFVAPDCFHPSHKAHQMFAFMLWNVMLTPVGSKPYDYTVGFDETLEYKCPTEEFPYIYTNCNSGDPKACGLTSARDSRDNLDNSADHVTSVSMSVLLATSMIASVVAQL